MAQHTSGIQNFLVSKSFDGDVFPGEMLSKHTSYRIGGPASFFVRVNCLSALTSLINECQDHDIPWFVLGKGTNLLVSDEGFHGVVISLGRDFKASALDKTSGILNCGAGVSLSNVVQDAFHNSLAGLEFAVGTPGSVGGAIRMNAGSSDTWIGSVVDSVTVFNIRRGLKRLYSTDITWDYRKTSLTQDDVIVECEIRLQQSDPFFIRNKMDEILARRRASQPLDLPSCGSVFKNPQGASAGALIQEVGLKGQSIGGAQVSEKHANFIVNRTNAKAADVKALIEYVQHVVWQEKGIALEPEVKFIGF